MKKSMLDKIVNKRIANENAEIARMNAINAKVADYTERIRNLAPRIKELIEIGIALYDNNIALGKKIGSYGYDYEFITEGCRHRLGFVRNGIETRPYAIGIEGGGCDGDDLYVSENGKFIKCPGPGRNGNYFDFICKCEKFINNFDDFEKRVFDYVNSL